MTSAPSWANIDATIDLPEPIPPVRPRTFTSDRTITRDGADQIDRRAGRLARRHRLLLHPGATTLSDLAPGSCREPLRSHPGTHSRRAELRRPPHPHVPQRLFRHPSPLHLLRLRRASHGDHPGLRRGHIPRLQPGADRRHHLDRVPTGPVRRPGAGRRADGARQPAHHPATPVSREQRDRRAHHPRPDRHHHGRDAGPERGPRRGRRRSVGGVATVASLLARAFEGFGWQGTAAIPAHEVFYWMHILAVLAFLVYIPSSKHMHIIVAIPNVFFRKLPPKIGAQLPAIDLEHAEHYGVSAVTQWSWKNLLDLYSCTECGRCQEQCPAFLTGKPLNPKMIIVDARENLFKTVRDAPPEQRRAPQQSQKLIGEAIKEDEIWACVSCGACQQECPVLIEHVPKIIDMRRSLVLEESKFPKEAQGALRSIETQGNPYGLPRAQRMDWAQGLGVKTIEENPDAEY